MKAALIRLENPETRQTAEIPVLVDGGPLCVAGIWNWKERCHYAGLYKIYHKRSTARVGPFYASIPLAEQGMRKALRDVPKDVWGHDIDWYQGQNWIAKWIDQNLGRPEDIVGGEWLKDEGKQE